MNIILIGLRGSGKTTIGKEVAKRLKMKFVSTDDLIVEKVGLSIKEIVEKEGWEKFRRMEKDIIKNVCLGDNLVIDTGGGIIADEENIRNLKECGKVVYLEAPPEVLEKRLRSTDISMRPPLKGESTLNEIKDISKERKRLYEKAADFKVDTSKITEDTIRKIISFVS